jgi:hypothetical protein
VAGFYCCSDEHLGTIMPWTKQVLILVKLCTFTFGKYNDRKLPKMTDFYPKLLLKAVVDDMKTFIFVLLCE